MHKQVNSKNIPVETVAKTLGTIINEGNGSLLMRLLTFNYLSFERIFWF